MKRKVIIIICAIITLTSITALSSEGILDFIEDATLPTFEISTDFDTEEDFDFSFELMPIVPPSEPEVILDDAESFISTVDNYLSANDFEQADLKRIKNRFISTLTEYKMTPEELTEVNSLISEDYDIEKVLDIYEFLRFTNSDVSMIAEIYLAGEQNSDKEFWIYDTYDRILDRTDDMLTVEDVAHYVASGLTVDEIVGAYELSFAGVKTTKQMLQERLDGMTWNTIAANAISDNPAIIENAPEMTIDNIMAYRAHAVRMRQDVSDIISIDDGVVSLKDNVLSEARELMEIKQSYIEQYDAELPIVPEEKEIKNYSGTDTAVPYTEEYLFEEDYIPVEEPEVE